MGHRRNCEPERLWDTQRAFKGLQGCGGWGGGSEPTFWRSRLREQSSHVAVPPLPVDKARQVSLLRVGSFPCSAEGSSVQ